MAPHPRTIQLWRRCLRCCKAMEGAMGNYYHGFAREHILAHRHEDDEARLERLLDKGEQNLRFVLRKYRITEPLGLTVLPTRATTATTATTRRRRAVTTPRAAGRKESEATTGGAQDSSSDSTWTPGR